MTFNLRYPGFCFRSKEYELKTVVLNFDYNLHYQGFFHIYYQNILS